MPRRVKKNIYIKYIIYLNRTLENGRHVIVLVNGWNRRRDVSVDGTGERTGCGLRVNGQYPWMDAMYA